MTTRLAYLLVLSATLMSAARTNHLTDQQRYLAGIPWFIATALGSLVAAWLGQRIEYLSRV